MSKSRRDFVKTAAGMSLAAAAAAAGNEIPKRRFGKTGLDVTIFGLGGGTHGNLPSQSDAVKVIQKARDLGVNYFDSAAAGAYGLSQKRLGVALNGDKSIYIGTKTRNRSYLHCELDLNQSLANTKRDYLDLYQVHNVMSEEDIEQIFAPRGTMELVEKAKKDGKVRYVGFTGHMDPNVHKKMMGMYDWDTILMPLGISDGARKDFSFEHTTLPVALDKGLGIQAMKVTGAGGMLKQKLASVEECLRYVFSLPISLAIVGCSTPEEVEENVNVAKMMADSQLSKKEMNGLRKQLAKADFKSLEYWKVRQMAV